MIVEDDDREMTGAERRLQRAKKAAKSQTTDNKRKWISTHVDSYDGATYRSFLHIMEGTPPRAYILENPERGICVVIGIDGDVLGHVQGGDYGSIDPVRMSEVVWFETSKGVVRGTLEDDVFKPDQAGLETIEELYNIDPHDSMNVAKGWVSIPLNDPFYGSPEYKIQTKNDA